MLLENISMFQSCSFPSAKGSSIFFIFKSLQSTLFSSKPPPHLKEYMLKWEESVPLERSDSVCSFPQRTKCFSDLLPWEVLALEKFLLVDTQTKKKKKEKQICLVLLLICLVQPSFLSWPTLRSRRYISFWNWREFSGMLCSTVCISHCNGSIIWPSVWPCPWNK